MQLVKVIHVLYCAGTKTKTSFFLQLLGTDIACHDNYGVAKINRSTFTVSQLAEEIIAAQNAEIEQMQAWRGEWYPDLAATGGMEMGMGEMMISEDESVPFDQRFIEAMISHHQGAIAMAEMALEQAEHEEIRMLAEDIIAAQNAEIEQMQAWLEEWYGDSQ